MRSLALLMVGALGWGQEQKLPFGNLKPLKVTVSEGGFALNTVPLEPLKIGTAKRVSLQLATPARIMVRAIFLPTIRITHGRPRLSSDKPRLLDYLDRFPKVAEAVGFNDAIGSLKPVTFELRKGPHALELFEETLLLFSSNPADAPQMRTVQLNGPYPLNTSASTPQPMDLQYRGLPHDAPALSTQYKLQLLYVRKKTELVPEVLAVFLIASRPSGDVEYYKLPAERLDAIVAPDDPLMGKQLFASNR